MIFDSDTERQEQHFGGGCLYTKRIVITAARTCHDRLDITKLIKKI